MEYYNQSEHPPDLPALTYQDLRDYEQGNRTLTVDELASAHYLRQTLMENTVVLATAV